MREGPLWARLGVLAVTCAVGAGVGWLFGSLSTIPYWMRLPIGEVPDATLEATGDALRETGPRLGLAGGLVAAVVWWLAMAAVVRSAARRGRRPWTISFGILLGIVVGVGCATLVHVGLARVMRQVVPAAYPFLGDGALFGGGAGAAAGLVCGALLRVLTKRPAAGAASDAAPAPAPQAAEPPVA